MINVDVELGARQANIRAVLEFLNLSSSRM